MKLSMHSIIGDTIAVVVVPSSAIEPLHSDEVLHVRQLQPS